MGMILYIQTGLDREERTRSVVEPYFRAATLITFISLALPLGVSLTLVVLPIGWSRLLYATSIAALAADLQTINTVRVAVRATGLTLLWMMEAVGTVLGVATAIIPLWTKGLSPGREDLVPGLLLGLAIGFLSTCVLVLTLLGSLGSSDPSRPPQRGRDGGDALNVGRTPTTGGQGRLGRAGEPVRSGGARSSVPSPGSLAASRPAHVERLAAP